MGTGKTIWLATIATLLVAGCADPAPSTPRDRMGSLPFPGTFTLYRVADPTRLGVHRYERPRRLLRADEGKHGILYTTRGGFLDVGHVRITTDHVRFAAERVREAMRTQSGQLELPTIEGSTFFVTLRYPPGYDPTDQATADELAIRTGQRLAYLMMTWHEVITWFGWSTVRGLSEQRSSFTWDDAMSHVVGLRVAGRAMRDRSRPFDEAVTIALREELSDLGVVGPAQTNEAIQSVEGLWWTHGNPLKRQLDVGLSDDTIRPWLVRGMHFAPDGAVPEAFYLPSLANVNGRDFSGFYSVRIDPNIPEAARMRAALPGAPSRFTGDRDLPLLVAETRREMRAQIAADVDQPWSISPLSTTRPANAAAHHPPLLSFLATKRIPPLSPPRVQR